MRGLGGEAPEPHGPSRSRPWRRPPVASLPAQQTARAHPPTPRHRPAPPRPVAGVYARMRVGTRRSAVTRGSGRREATYLRRWVYVAPEEVVAVDAERAREQRRAADPPATRAAPPFSARPTLASQRSGGGEAVVVQRREGRRQSAKVRDGQWRGRRPTRSRARLQVEMNPP